MALREEDFARKAEDYQAAIDAEIGDLPDLDDMGIEDEEHAAIIKDFLFVARKIHSTYDAGDAAMAFVCQDDKECRKALDDAGLSPEEIRIALKLAKLIVRSPDDDE